MLELEFMQRAFLAAMLVGVTAPAVGTFLLQRRLALIGDGMGHVALAGVAAGVLTSTSPVWTALLAAVAGAVLVEVLRRRGGGDMALAVLFYGGIAGGVVLISLSASGTPANLNSYLFGSVTTTTAGDLWIFAGLSVVVLGVVAFFGTHLFAVSDDEDYAQASGINVLSYNLLLAVLTAVTVVVSMRVIGLLLISALMTIPNAVAQQLVSGFRATMATAVAVGLGSGIVGVAMSYYVNSPSGGTVVMVCIAALVLAAGGRGLLRLARRHPSLRYHPHEHGPGCGHQAVVHDGHVDYLHDGHRHAEHGAHYDEH